MKKIVKAVKYRLAREALTDVLAFAGAQHGDDLFLFNKITSKKAYCIPVPLHAKRFAQRGFNQAALLAEYFSHVFKKSYSDGIVWRTTNTLSQTATGSSRSRIANISGAFALCAGAETQVRAQEFVVIDDVWTTGATVKEIAKVLKRSGTARVYGLTLAR